MKGIVLMGFLSFVLGLLGCGKPSEKAARKEPPTNERKERTVRELESLGIPVNPWLPIIESDEEARIRDPEDAARRAIILYAVTSAGHGDDRGAIIAFLKDESLWDHVSPNEKALFEDEKPSEQTMVDATWRAEALWVLLWSLGKIGTLDLPTEFCNTDLIHDLMPKPGEVAESVRSATLRPKSAILDETDRIYRLHWAVRDAQLNNRPVPANLDPGVVMERHYALNWLTWYGDEWDDITTDT
jgi:hypothetical protein